MVKGPRWLGYVAFNMGAAALAYADHASVLKWQVLFLNGLNASGYEVNECAADWSPCSITRTTVTRTILSERRNSLAMCLPRRSSWLAIPCMIMLGFHYKRKCVKMLMSRCCRKDYSRRQELLNRLGQPAVLFRTSSSSIVRDFTALSDALASIRCQSSFS